MMYCVNVALSKPKVAVFLVTKQVEEAVKCDVSVLVVLCV